jgi:hypothetical protein
MYSGWVLVGIVLGMLGKSASTSKSLPLTGVDEKYVGCSTSTSFHLLLIPL